MKEKFKVNHEVIKVFNFEGYMTFSFVSSVLILVFSLAFAGILNMLTLPENDYTVKGVFIFSGIVSIMTISFAMAVFLDIESLKKDKVVHVIKKVKVKRGKR